MLYRIIGGPRSGDSSARYSHISNIEQTSNIKAENREKVNNRTVFATLPNLPLLTCFKEQTRAFLKVQDGCDGLCTYCIIPKVRPEVQSKPIEEAVFEAKTLVAAGHKEIVVTGVNLGSYGRDTTRKTWVPDRKAEEAAVEDDASRQLADLLGKLADIEGPFDSLDYARDRSAPPITTFEGRQGRLPRIRVSSLEPGDITGELLDVFCRHSNIMPHIHLSVQSGSENVLKRMCRPYSAGVLREKISMIKGRLDRPAITCDMIVGFPGETEEEFQETIELSKWAGFSKMHVFPFSVRTGTAAAKMKGRIDSKVIKKRAEILRRLGDELGRRFREQFVGETCEVLIEDTNPPAGHCERYFIVKLDPWAPDQSLGSSLRFEKNEIVRVKITAVDEEGAEGERSKKLKARFISGHEGVIE
jgi:threonylcarbamoyladenosine tRNA methylthiotransferase MtaB